MKYEKARLVDFVKEAYPMMVKNNDEVNVYNEKLDLDFEAYFESEQAGVIHSFTLRDNDNELIGYSIFLVSNMGHHKSVIYAYQDVIYVNPKYRICGIKFIRYTEKELKKLGVDVVLHGCPNDSRIGGVLERLGYNEIEKIYGRRL